MTVEPSDRPDPLPSGTVTFLISDVADSTGSSEASRAVTAEALSRYEEIVTAAVVANRGARAPDHDAHGVVVCVFARASDAACAARDAQLALRREPWPSGLEPAVRMALHTGEAHLREGRFYSGPDLDRCTRLVALAHGAQVIVSRTTHELLDGQSPEGFSFRHLGKYRLGGLGRAAVVHQLCHHGLAASFPPLTRPVDSPSNLPVVASSFVGRAHELAEILELLSRAHLATLTGSGGCGKTRLALEAGRALLAGSPDGVWWVDLAPVSDPSLVPVVALAALGGRADVGADPLAALAAFVADRDLVILIDNAEHLLDACARLCRFVLENAPGVRLLVTSREPIGIDGEWVWRVPSLPTPETDAAVDGVLRSDAGRLFEERARQARADFRVTDDNATAVTRICRRLDGIPLAIELAAARVRVISPERIAAGLDDRFRLLTGGPRGSVPRQQTLQSSVEWSHELLGTNEQLAFRRLAVFCGGFTLAAAEAVIADDELPRAAVLDLLTRLVDKSLIISEATGDQPRHRLLETMRQYAHDRLSESGELETLRDRHLAWCVDLAANAEPELTSSHQVPSLYMLEREHENLRAAFDWAYASRAGRSLWSLAGNLAHFWVLHGHFAEASHTIERAAAVGDEVPLDEQLAGRWASAYTTFFSGRFERAAHEAREVLGQARRCHDDRIVARALCTLGATEMFFDGPTARAHLHEAVALTTARGEDYWRREALTLIAQTHLFQDDYGPAQAAFAAACTPSDLPLSEQQAAWIHVFRAHVAFGSGELRESRAEAEAAMRVTDRTGDPAAAAIAMHFLGAVAIREGQANEIVPVLRERLDQSIGIGAKHGIPPVAVSLALAEGAAGRPAAGLALLDDPTLDIDNLGGLYPRVIQHTATAMLRVAVGAYESALAATNEALEYASALDSRFADTTLLHVLGWIDLVEGRPIRAEERGHAALSAALAGPFPAEIADALRLLGLVAAAMDSPVEATRLLAAAEALAVVRGGRCTIFSALVGAPDTSSLRTALGERAFDEAWTEGAALSFDAAVAYASRARGKRRRPSFGWDSLTPTELSVAELVAEGCTNQQIGKRLFVSAGTAKTHLAHILAKLGFTNRAEIAAEVVRRRASAR